MKEVTLVLVAYFAAVYGRPPTHREALIHDLLHDYVKEARPHGCGSSDTTHVEHVLGLRKLNEHHENVLSLDAWSLLYWVDSRLSWDPNDYCHIENVTIPADQLWIPDIELYNYGGDRDGRVHHESWVSHYGHVVYSPSEKLVVNCEESTNAAKFHCTLVFGSWTQNNDFIHLTKRQDNIDEDLHAPNSDLHLVSANISEATKTFHCCPGHYDELRYLLTLSTDHHEEVDHVLEDDTHHPTAHTEGHDGDHTVHASDDGGHGGDHADDDGGHGGDHAGDDGGHGEDHGGHGEDHGGHDVGDGGHDGDDAGDDGGNGGDRAAHAGNDGGYGGDHITNDNHEHDHGDKHGDEGHPHDQDNNGGNHPEPNGQSHHGEGHAFHPRNTRTM